MKLVGFIKQNNGNYTEYLPYNEQLSSDRHKRVIFFSMFNTYMEKDLRFSKSEMTRLGTIEETFRAKIISEINISCIKTYTPYSGAALRMDISSSLLIHAYFLGKDFSFPLKSKPFLRIGKLISLLYSPSGLSLMLNLDDMFLHLVYERIKKVNKEANVLLFEKSIVIKHRRKEVSDSLIIPSYRKIDKDKLHDDKEFRKHMDTVKETLNTGEITQVFLVYPKHPNFKKYINIKLPYHTKLNQHEYKVKVMPYSFSFCAKSSKRKTRKRTRV